MNISKTAILFTTYLLCGTFAYASPVLIAKELHLVAGKKAIIQWERVFKSERKMKKYGIDKLSKTQQIQLKKYLLDHAADSDHPTVAGM